jgi:hypothetical protein
MDAEKAERDERLAIAAHSLKIRWDFLHPGYRVEHGSCERIGGDALEILKIICINDERRFFRGRWDRDRKTPAGTLDDRLDFDLFLPDATMCDDFKRGRGGWSGHHTKLESDPDSRTFEVEIKSPDRLICKGTVSFTITVPKRPVVNVKIGEFLDGTLVKGGRSD